MHTSTERDALSPGGLCVRSAPPFCVHLHVTRWAASVARFVSCLLLTQGEGGGGHTACRLAPRLHAVAPSISNGRAKRTGGGGEGEGRVWWGGLH